MLKLETDRLELRRFSSSDWKDMYEYLSLEEVVKYEPYGIFTQDQCKEEAINRSEQEAFWAVCLKCDNKLIGNVYFNQIEPKDLLTWEIGYVFNPSYYGKGYATEGCKKILEYGFKELKSRRIVAMCNPQNEPSWRLLERLNMRREGHLRKNIYFKCDEEGEPVWNDTYEYAILGEEWFKQYT